MILKIKVTSIENHIDTGEEVVKVNEVDFILKDSIIEGVWVEPDLEEMYVYVKGERVTAIYDRGLHQKICVLLGHPNYDQSNIENNGIS